MSVFGEYVPARRGWLLGMTVPQVAVMAGFGLAFAGTVSRNAWGMTLLVAVAWAVTGSLLLVPVRGRPALSWVGAWALHGFARVTGLSTWRSQAALGRGGPDEVADLPGILSSVQIHDGPPVGTAMRRTALVQDHATHTWAVTAEVTHPGIVLREGDERIAQGRGLTGLIDQMAVGEMVSEVIAIVRTIPDDGAEREQWVADHRSPDAPAGAVRVVDELEAALTGVSVRQESYVTAVVEESTIARAAKEAGGGVAGRGRVLGDVMAELGSSLAGGVGMERVQWLTSPQLAAATRTGFAPGDRAGIVKALGDRARNSNVNADVPWSQAGPGGAVPAVTYYEHDGWRSVSCTLKLPERGAAMGALRPVLVPGAPGERRSLAVVWPVKTLQQADRETRLNESVADVSDALNEKLGRQPRARDKKAARTTRDLDSKQAQGNSLTVPHAIVTITVPKEASIADAGRRLESAVRRAGFAPLRLDVAQDIGFCASVIPLGINLARKGAV